MGDDKIKEGIHYVGCVDWDRRLFDELIPLPDGTTYNSYLIKGSEKTALIDAVDPTMEAELLNKLEKLRVKKLDYIVSHHAEQDHSGAIPSVLEKYPDAKVVTNPQCAGFLSEHLHLDKDQLIQVEDGQTLSLGDKTLKFIYMPWVHWPETMITLLVEDRILFTCDLFGSHFATSDLYVKDLDKAYDDAKRYYAEIMMPFRQLIKGHLKKISEYDLDMIATSHGPIYDRPQFILEAYGDWVSDEVKNEAVLAYVSMHGSVKKMVDYLGDKLREQGIKVKRHNLTGADIGALAMDLVDAATLIIASPTVLTGPHPSALYATYLTGILRPKTRHLAIVGSYGWGGLMVEKLKAQVENLEAELLEPVLAKGLPTVKELKNLDDLADKIAEKHRGLGLM